MPEDVEPEDESARTGEGQIAGWVRKLAQNEGIHQPGLNDLLGGELRYLRDIWRIDTSNDSEIVRLAVRQRLLGYLTQIPPRRPPSTETQNERQKKFQIAYPVLFNLDADSMGTTKLKLEERKALIAKRTGLSKPTVDRDLTYSVNSIEALILRHNKPPTPPAPLPSLPPALPEPELPPTERVAAADDLVEEEQSSDRRRKAVKGVMAIGLGVIVVATGVFLEQHVSGTTDTPPVSGTTSTPKANSPETVPAPQPEILKIGQPSYVQGVNQGFSYAFAHPPNFTAQDLAEANKLQNNWKGLFDWVQPHHGVIVNEAVIQVVINNPRSGTVVIRDMELVEKQCQAPLSGGLLFSPPAASNRDAQMLFNLDTTETEPHLYQDFNDGGRYFTGPSAQYLTVTQDKPETILMHAVTNLHDCQFKVRIDATAPDGTKASFVISDSGKPFEVTTIPQNVATSSRDFTGYKELWAGGVASPNDTGSNPNGNYTPVDPKTFSG